MADSADHLTAKTGLTPTVTISKNGGTFGAAAGAVSEVGNGWYVLAGNATDRATLGSLILHAEAAGADKFDMDYYIVSYDPFMITGTSTYTETITDSSTGLPVVGADVECYSDTGRTALVDTKESDVNGSFTFYLNPGTYYFRAIEPGEYTSKEWSAVVA
jgi:hypothetical protein